MATLHGGFHPRRQPLPLAAPVEGQRVVLIDVDEQRGRSHYRRDYRIVGGMLVDEAGRRVITVVAEADWPVCHGTCDAAKCTHRMTWPAELIWAN